MIERVVQVLDSFKTVSGTLTASEIARKTAIPMPSAHRIVAELVDVGFLERDPDHRLRIGTRLWEVVARSSSALTLREVALPYMEDLRSAVHALASSPGIVLATFSAPEVREHILATGRITRFTEHTVPVLAGDRTAFSAGRVGGRHDDSRRAVPGEGGRRRRHPAVAADTGRVGVPAATGRARRRPRRASPVPSGSCSPGGRGRHSRRRSPPESCDHP